MGLTMYSCKQCKRDVPVRESKGYGFCRYCGVKLLISDAMRRNCGKSDRDIALSTDTIVEFAENFGDKCEYGWDEAISFVKTFASSKDAPDLMMSAVRLLEKDLGKTIVDDVRNELVLALLESAAGSDDYGSDGWLHANKRLAAAYHHGDDSICSEDKEKAKKYYYNISKNPDYAADAFYNIYLASDTESEQEAWLASAARYGHPLAISKTKKSSEGGYILPCEYMIGGSCTRLSNSLVIVACPYYERGECQAHCSDYKGRAF